MQKYFNIAGPCNSSKHYMLDPLRNMNNELMDLIRSEQYFVIHAARQSGKTTLLLELTDKINAEGKYHALYCSLEILQGIKESLRGIPTIVRKIKTEIENSLLPTGFAKDADFEDVDNMLNRAFVSYCRSLDKPLVVFFDEADCLSNETLISFLRQLRDGFISRSRTPFVHSIALVGMRNLRDYKAQIRPDSDTLGSSSPFNIVTDSLNIKSFTKEEIIELYSQHTKATGQIFEPQAVDYIFKQTNGQPWLVNAVAREAIEKILQKDYSKSITVDIVKQSIHDIILARSTHFDSLMERLKEPRVRKIIEPLILGEGIVDRISDDYLYVKDLGLIKESGNGIVEPSNQIYAEIIVRTLNYSVQENLKVELPNDNLPKYVKDGKIDVNYLLKEFQVFWRENSEIWVKRYKENFYEYEEAAPHLVLQGFLQRVINGGGQIDREMALGTKRADICIKWENQKYPIELKLYKNEKTTADAIPQILRYMEKCGVSEGWLFLFDRSTEKSWEDKLYFKEEIVNEKKINIFGG
jgi:hypothetical protein